jgi:hypothetical protein
VLRVNCKSSQTQRISIKRNARYERKSAENEVEKVVFLNTGHSPAN